MQQPQRQQARRSERPDSGSPPAVAAAAARRRQPAPSALTLSVRVWSSTSSSLAGPDSAWEAATLPPLSSRATSTPLRLMSLAWPAAHTASATRATARACAARRGPISLSSRPQSRDRQSLGLLCRGRRCRGACSDAAPIRGEQGARDLPHKPWGAALVPPHARCRPLPPDLHPVLLPMPSRHCLPVHVC